MGAPARAGYANILLPVENRENDRYSVAVYRESDTLYWFILPRPFMVLELNRKQGRVDRYSVAVYRA